MVNHYHIHNPSKAASQIFTVGWLGMRSSHHGCQLFDLLR